jgi:hypothetical protein
VITFIALNMSPVTFMLFAAMRHGV